MERQESNQGPLSKKQECYPLCYAAPTGCEDSLVSNATISDSYKKNYTMMKIDLSHFWVLSESFQPKLFGQRFLMDGH